MTDFDRQRVAVDRITHRTFDGNELLDAVDALTQPSRTKVPQWVTRDGKDVQVVTVIDHEPLLTQLEAAIRSSMSGKAGGGNPATRNVLDSDALFAFARITATIGDWCRIEKATVTRDPVKDLRAWYVARLTRNLDDTFYLRELHKWAGLIRSKLDPPRQIQVTEPCVVCQAAVWTDDEGNERRHPVVIQYREGEPDILQHAWAVCRACEHVWKGSSELRGLRYEIDTREAS